MDSKKLKALLTAIEYGSLTSAAEELGYTQSGLTHMMNALENEMGLNILVRSKTGVHLSPAGQELLPDIKAFVSSAENLERSADKLRERSYSTLRLGAYSSIARHWTPSILSAFKQICPGIDVSVTMNSIRGIYDSVKNDELDCAIVSYQQSMCQGLHWIPMRKDELVAILPQEDSHEGTVFPVEDFEGLDFLMPSSGFDLDITPVFAGAQGKVAPNVRYTNMDDATIVSMVNHGLGVTIMSELVMQGISDNVRILKLDPPAYRELGVIVNDKQQNSRIIRRFIQCTQETVTRIYTGD